MRSIACTTKLASLFALCFALSLGCGGTEEDELWNDGAEMSKADALDLFKSIIPDWFKRGSRARLGHEVQLLTMSPKDREFRSEFGANPPAFKMILRKGAQVQVDVFASGCDADNGSIEVELYQWWNGPSLWEKVTGLLPASVWLKALNKIFGGEHKYSTAKGWGSILKMEPTRKTMGDETRLLGVRAIGKQGGPLWWEAKDEYGHVRFNKVIEDGAYLLTFQTNNCQGGKYFFKMSYVEDLDTKSCYKTNLCEKLDPEAQCGFWCERWDETGKCTTPENPNVHCGYSNFSGMSIDGTSLWFEAK
ncbi:MAG: hypothetical protein V1754_08505 [Pseudomonadota bacterium]